VKTKSTSGKFSPIADAIEDCEKDRTSRLAKTLVWLRDRALFEDLGDVSVDQLERFIRATDFPAATKRFRAVAVICATLLDAELAATPVRASSDYTLVVIAVPDLHRIYSGVFAAALQSATQPQTTLPPRSAR